MSRQYLNDLSDGDSVEEIYLLADKQLRANRNADLYLLATLRDKTGIMSGLMWNVTEESVGHINPGDFVRVKGKVQLYQGSLQMILANIRLEAPDGLDVTDFHPSSGKDIEKLTQKLREILLGIEDPNLRTLMECFLLDEELLQQLQRAPAGVKAHHAYHGGLLEHIVNMLEVASAIEKFYPELNHDLLLAGIFLHDLGKVREMAYEASFVYTDEGQLVGHLIIGVEMLNEKIQEAEAMLSESFPAALALQLKHLIVSHHGTYEYGSPKLPMTLEAIALHYLDNLDAKVHEFATAMREDPNPESNWTPFSPRLNRKLFKGDY